MKINSVSSLFDSIIVRRLWRLLWLVCSSRKFLDFGDTTSVVKVLLAVFSGRVIIRGK